VSCATQYAASGGTTVFPSAGNFDATLVLECRTRHFSTDAFNSVLIAQPIISRGTPTKSAIA
jgi:hypothetical protein